MKVLFCFLNFVCGVMSVYSQIQENRQSLEEYIADIYEQYTSETEDEINFEQFYEELINLTIHPINLNITTREELKKMQFLSDVQIENIVYYFYKYGPMRSIYELQLIEGLDMTDIRYMLPFVTLGQGISGVPPLKADQVLRYGQNELMCSFSKIIEKKAGYILSESDSSKYRGNSLYNYIKYRFNYKDRLMFNFTVEKDAGEDILKVNKGVYDFCSASVQVKNAGVIKNIVVGDFQAGFGQGLVINQAFSSGKTSITSNIMSVVNGFKSYKSTNESNFLRGGAISFQQKNIDVHLFYSNRQIDGDIQGNTFSAFIKTGYHRSENESQNRQRVKEVLCGGNITLTGQLYQLGFSSVFLCLDHHLVLKQLPYNIFYFEGSRQLVSGLNYRIRWHKFNLFGETAVAEKSFSTINGVTFSPIARVNVALLYRNFSPGFNAVFASAFSESSRISNEKGFYVGVEMQLIKFWKLVAYADSYQFPWLKYGVDMPSAGKDFLVQATYSPTRHVDMFWRFKHEQNMNNVSVSEKVTNEIVQSRKSSIRFQMTYVTGNFNFKTMLEGNIFERNHALFTYGLAALQELSFSCEAFPLAVDMRYVIFDAANYENRIYIHEKDILNAFSSPVLSGSGSRYYINMQYRITNELSVWVKFSQNIFADEIENIGSGNELIRGNKKSEIKCLLRWKFSNN